MNISKLSVKRPVLVTMIVLVFVVIGMFSLTMLPMELMPKMELSMALVYTSYPNVGSHEVENMVTKPIENAIGSVSGVKGITSQSSEGSSMVMIEFASKTNMDKAIQDIKDSVDMIKGYLPEDAEEPMTMKLDTSMMPVAVMSVSHEGMDLIQTKKYIENNVVNKIEAVSGVASATVSGAQDRIIEVEMDPEKLFGYKISMSDAVAAIAAQNANLPAGSIMSRNKKLTTRAMGKFDSVNDIEAVPLVTPTGQILYLKDVASIKDTYSDAATMARLNGDNSLSITVSSESDANTVDVVNAMIKALEDIKAQNPKFNYKMVMEQASYIEDSISSVTSNALTGAVLAIFILLLFLANFKTSMVIGVSIPTSVITTFVGMYFWGISINVVALGGLALGVGMLVDNSVVVLENIFRRRQEYGEDAITSSIKGSTEMISSVVASVLTTCIVYVPILFIDNMMAIMFKQFAFVIIFSQIASLMVTFLLVPMLTSKIHDVQPNKKLEFILKPFGTFLDKVYIWYEKGLRWTLSHRKSFISGVMAVFMLSLVVLGMIGMTLMNSTDQGSLTVSVELPHGATIEETNEITMDIEKTISENKNVEDIFANIGSGGMISLGQSSANASSITVTLKKNRSDSTDETAQQLRDALSDVTGATIDISSASAMNMGTNSIEFEFTGNDDEELEKYVKSAEKVLAGIDGVVSTSTSISETKPEIQISVDADKAARYGLSTATVANYVYSVLEGTSAGRYTENGLEYDIKLTYPDGYAEDINQLKNMRIPTMTGQWISLSDVAGVSEKQGSLTLTRVDQKRVITLTGTLYNTNMGTVNNKFDDAIKEIPLPEGINRHTGGEYEVMIDAIGSLLLAIFLGIVLMYMVMAAQFENLLHPFIILFTLPLAMIGVVLGHIVAGMPLSVVSCIGILMLIGIVVNNAIILIDFISSTRRDDPTKERTEVLVYAGKTRMRPVLMTSLTSILGFLPMALALGSTGAEMMQPLAVSLTGGLTVGTILTLFVIPVVYSLFDDRIIKRKIKKERKQS